MNQHWCRDLTETSRLLPNGHKSGEQPEAAAMPGDDLGHASPNRVKIIKDLKPMKHCNTNYASATSLSVGFHSLQTPRILLGLVLAAPRHHRVWISWNNQKLPIQQSIPTSLWKASLYNCTETHWLGAHLHNHKRAAAIPCICIHTPVNDGKCVSFDEHSETFPNGLQRTCLPSLSSFLPSLLPLFLLVFLKQGLVLNLRLVLHLQCSCLRLQLLRFTSMCHQAWHLLPFTSPNQVTCSF